MLFGLRTRVGPANYILHGVHIPVGMGNFDGGRPIVNYRDILCDYLCKKGREPIEMPFGLWAWMVQTIGIDGPWHLDVLGGDPDVRGMLPR